MVAGGCCSGSYRSDTQWAALGYAEGGQDNKNGRQKAPAIP